MKNFKILRLNSRCKTDWETAKFCEHSLSTTWTSLSKQDSFLLIQQVHLRSKKWMMSDDTRNNCNIFEKPTTCWKSSKECVTNYPGLAIKSTATSINSCQTSCNGTAESHSVQLSLTSKRALQVRQRTRKPLF